MAAVTALALVAIAVPLAGGRDEARAASLQPFGDCAAVDDWFTGMASPRVGPYGLEPDDGGWLEGLFAGPVAGAGEDAAASGAGGAEARSSLGEAVGPGATGTNVQEQGVDEPDLVKTSGDRVVTVTSGSLHVLRVSGDRLHPLGSVALPGGGALELLLLGDRAVVLGGGFVGGPDTPADGPGAPAAASTSVASSTMPYPGHSTTTVTVVDLSDPAAPRLVRSEEIEGGYLSARASGEAVRIVIGSTPRLPFQPPRPSSAPPVDPASPDPALSEPRHVAPSAEELEAAEARNRAALQEMDGEDWLPHRIVRDPGGAVSERVPAVGCGDVAHPVEPAGLGTTLVLTLDAGAAALPVTDSTAVAADSGTVYASPDRLYIATTAWGREESTDLHSFDTTDPAGTRYRASGDVPGVLLGRWALDEHDGLMRVATTVGGWTARSSESFVTVLAEEGGELVPRGSVGGLGPDEHIRAVRWFDDLALVVTFRQIDPLYTVDLSDPAQPQVTGELKVNGYSGYLHPLGDGLVLGVGQDGTAEGELLGAQVSTFDLRDPAAPQRLHTLTMPQTWSDVEMESRAFSYLPSERLALVPVSGPSGSRLTAVRVGADGTLQAAGEHVLGRDQWLVRAVPAAGGVVTVSDGAQGRTLTLLGLPELAERDAVDLR